MNKREKTRQEKQEEKVSMSDKIFAIYNELQWEIARNGKEMKVRLIHVFTEVTDLYFPQKIAMKKKIFFAVIGRLIHLKANVQQPSGGCLVAFRKISGSIFID